METKCNLTLVPKQEIWAVVCCLARLLWDVVADIQFNWKTLSNTGQLLWSELKFQFWREKMFTVLPLFLKKWQLSDQTNLFSVFCDLPAHTCWYHFLWGVIGPHWPELEINLKSDCKICLISACDWRWGEAGEKWRQSPTRQIFILIWTNNLWMFQLYRIFSDNDFLKGIDDCEDARQARAYMFC